MSSVAVAVVAFQCFLLAVFAFFAFFNYLYALASLRKPGFPKRAFSAGTVGIVSEHQKLVRIRQLVAGANCVIQYMSLVVGYDDDTDRDHPGSVRHEMIEIWESPDFVFFHRPSNAGFKAGNLQKVHQYLESRGVDHMYLLDADWHPEPDVIERTVELLGADEAAAFVQTKRVSFPNGMNLFR